MGEASSGREPGRPAGRPAGLRSCGFLLSRRPGPRANREQVRAWPGRLLSLGYDVGWAGLGSQGWAWDGGLGTRFLKKC